METLSSLKKQIAKNRTEMDNLILSIDSDPDVKRAKEAYDKIIKKVRKNVEIKTTKIAQDQWALRKKVEELEKKTEIEIPQEVKDFLERLYRGCDWGPKGFTVKWISPQKRFIIATNTGHGYWSGRMVHYGKSEHYLFDISRLGDLRNGIYVRNDCQISTCDGRLSKETMNQWKNNALAMEEKEHEKK